MRVKLKNRRNNEFDAQLDTFIKSDLIHLNRDWKFNWKKLFDSQSKFYKVVHDRQIQGIIKLEEENEAYYVLKNIEVAPWNFGSKGRYKNVTEILMALACLKSFELNTGNYKGFLVFTSKGNLIEYYQKKYGAELIFRERMIINPEIAKKLIFKHLKIDLNNE